MPRHYQPTTRPLLPQVVAPLPTFAAGLTNVGAPAVRLKYAQADFVSQVRPTLATLPNLASDLSKPGAPAVCFKYAPPSYVAPPKYNLITAATPTVPSWTPTIALPQVDLRYALGDFVMPTGIVTTAFTRLATALAEIARQALDLTYLNCSFDTQVGPTLATLPTFLQSDSGGRAQDQNYTAPDFLIGTATQVQTATPFVAADVVRVAVALAYSISNVVSVVLANIPPLFNPPQDHAPSAAIKMKYALGDFVSAVLANIPPLFNPPQDAPAQPAVRLKYAVSDFVSAVRANIIPLLVPPLAEVGAKALTQRYSIADFVAQIAPTLATLPSLLFGIAEQAPNAQPQRYAGPNLVGPDKFNIIAPAQTFLPGWMSTDAKLAVLLKYAQADTWVGQIKPTLATLPTLLYGLAEIFRTANPPTYAQTPPYTAPDKFNIVAAAQTFLPGWLANVAAPIVALRYWLPDAITKPLGVFSIAVASSTTTNYEILAKLLAAVGVPNEVLGTRASPKGTNEEALGTRQSAKAENYEAKGTVVSIRGENQEAKGFVTAGRPSSEEILASVSPKQAKVVYEVLRGVAGSRGLQQEAAGKVTSAPRTPYEVISAIFNPAAVLAGQVLPVIGVLGAKVLPSISAATSKVLQALGIQSGKIVN